MQTRLDWNKWLDKTGLRVGRIEAVNGEGTWTTLATIQSNLEGMQVLNVMAQDAASFHQLQDFIAGIKRAGG